MNIIQMGGRPGTPSRTRLEMADLLIHQDAGRANIDPKHVCPWEKPSEPNPAHHDVLMLLDYLDIYFFSMEAHEQLAQLDDTEQINNNIDMLDLAANGTNEKFIGMLIDRRNDRVDDAGEPDNLEEEEDGIIVTCLYRDPEWVGLNEQLQDCRGLEVHVFSYKDDPEEPYLIIAVRPGYIEGGAEQPQPQGEINEAVREATMWYEARSCTFHVIDENKPQDQENDLSNQEQS